MSNFETMDYKELRRYVLANRHDREALEILVKRFRANPKLRKFAAEEVDRLGELLREKDQQR